MVSKRPSVPGKFEPVINSKKDCCNLMKQERQLDGRLSATGAGQGKESSMNEPIEISSDCDEEVDGLTKCQEKGACSSQSDSCVSDEDSEYEVEMIKDVKFKMKRLTSTGELVGVIKYFVKWKNYPMEEASWEPESNLADCQALDKFERKARNLEKIKRAKEKQKRFMQNPEAYYAMKKEQSRKKKKAGVNHFSAKNFLAKTANRKFPDNLEDSKVTDLKQLDHKFIDRHSFGCSSADGDVDYSMPKLKKRQRLVSTSSSNESTDDMPLTMRMAKDVSLIKRETHKTTHGGVSYEKSSDLVAPAASSSFSKLPKQSPGTSTTGSSMQDPVTGTIDALSSRIPEADGAHEDQSTTMAGTMTGDMLTNVSACSSPNPFLLSPLIISTIAHRVSNALDTTIARQNSDAIISTHAIGKQAVEREPKIIDQRPQEGHSSDVSALPVIVTPCRNDEPVLVVTECTNDADERDLMVDYSVEAPVLNNDCTNSFVTPLAGALSLCTTGQPDFDAKDAASSASPEKNVVPALDSSLTAWPYEALFSKYLDSTVALRVAPQKEIATEVCASLSAENVSRLRQNLTELVEALSDCQKLTAQVMDETRAVYSRPRFDSLIPALESTCDNYRAFWPSHQAALKVESSVMLSTFKVEGDWTVDDLNRKLSLAVKSGNVHALKSCVHLAESRHWQLDFDQPDKYGYSLVHIVSCHRCVSAPSEDGEHEYCDMLKALICHGAKVNAQSMSGVRPLHLAAAAGDERKVHTLLMAGACVNALDTRNRTPLCYAVEYMHCSTTLILCYYGADANHCISTALDGNIPEFAERLHGPESQISILLRQYLLRVNRAFFAEVTRVTPQARSLRAIVPLHMLRVCDYAGADDTYTLSFTLHALRRNAKELVMLYSAVCLFYVGQVEVKLFGPCPIQNVCLNRVPMPKMCKDEGPFVTGFWPLYDGVNELTFQVAPNMELDDAACVAFQPFIVDFDFAYDSSTSSNLSKENKPPLSKNTTSMCSTVQG